MKSLSLAIGSPSLAQEETSKKHSCAVKGDDVPTDSALWDEYALELPTGAPPPTWQIVGTPYCAKYGVIFEFL